MRYLKLPLSQVPGSIHLPHQEPCPAVPTTARRTQLPSASTAPLRTARVPHTHACTPTLPLCEDAAARRAPSVRRRRQALAHTADAAAAAIPPPAMFPVPARCTRMQMHTRVLRARTLHKQSSLALARARALPPGFSRLHSTTPCISPVGSQNVAHDKTQTLRELSLRTTILS